MSHSAEQMRKKIQAREEAMHHMNHSSVMGKKADMPMPGKMKKHEIAESPAYERKEEGMM